MKLKYENGLIFVDLSIEYNGKVIDVDNVVLDTGAAHTIINPDCVSELGIKAEPNDTFITMYGVGGEHYAYRKMISSVGVARKALRDTYIDFGIIDDEGEINGLLGLDILLKLGVKINLDELVLEID